MEISISTPHFQSKNSRNIYTNSSSEIPKLVIPGDIIHTETDYIKGHGVYEKDGKLYSSYCGIITVVNKLIYISPLKSRYIGHAGDVVVGRVDETSNGKWYVEIGAGQRAQLSIHSINLPGSIHRKRVDEDYLEMRKYFVEGDIICCEDTNILLHTRTARYGNLENGCLVKVSPCLIQKQSRHIIKLANNVQVILGNNGYIWISSPLEESSHDQLNFSTQQNIYKNVELEMREKVARIRNCILALYHGFFSITPEAISRAYDLSAQMNYTLTDLLKEDKIIALLNTLSN